VGGRKLGRMSVVDPLFSLPAVRKLIWRFWYPYLTRRLRADDVLFLNYAFETEPPVGLPLAAEDEINRYCIQLYHHVATQAELRGKDVLEVSCGHGGGASYLSRTCAPRSYTGLDLNPAGIAFCRERHRVPGLDFVRGDAGKLPHPDASLDVVVNVEASHCYPDFAAFVREVARVLRPGSRFVYADFRFTDEVDAWESALAGGGLRKLQQREINREVLRGMDANAARSEKLITRHLPKFLHSLGRDFAGIPGSRIHAALAEGRLSYRSYAFVKGATAESPCFVQVVLRCSIDASAAMLWASCYSSFSIVHWSLFKGISSRFRAREPRGCVLRRRKWARPGQ
jgi:SAM-dependent methyltransferase